MFTTVITIIAVILLIIIGFLRNRYECNKIVDRINFTLDFNNNLVGLVDPIASNLSSNIDSEKYHWLMEAQYKIQIELGADGTIFYRDPLKGIQSSNYQVIPNFLLAIPQYVRELNNSYSLNRLMHERFIQEAEICASVLSTHLGRLNSELETKGNHGINIFFYFSQGVKTVLEIPFIIFNSIGLISDRSLDSITHSKIFSFLSALGTLLALFATIIELFVTWDSFKEILSNILK